MEDARGQLPALQATIESKKLTPQGAEAAQKALAELDDALGPDAYWRAATWKRIVVIFAGPAANILLAIVLLTGLFLAVGGKATTTVEAVAPDSAAEQAGLLPGDRVVAIDGRPLGPAEISKTITSSKGRPLVVTVQRNGTVVRLKPVSARQLDDGNYRLGFVLRGEGLSPVAAAGEALRVTGLVTKEIGASLTRLVSGSGRDEISSPVGIVQGSSEAAKAGRRLLHLGACAHFALAGADQSAAAAAPRRRPHRLRDRRGHPRARQWAARSTSASRWSGSRSCCCSSSSASRTTSAGCRSSAHCGDRPRESPPLQWVAGGQRGSDQGRQRRNRRRRARRRPVDDADEDARRRGDDGPDRRARLGRLRDRARGGAEERGRCGAADDRPPLADAGDRRHPFQRLAGAEGDRRRRRRGADQPRQHRRPREGRAGRARRQAGRDPDADRRQLRLAARAPARAGPARTRPRRSWPLRSRRSSCSRGSTTAISRSRSSRPTSRR